MKKWRRFLSLEIGIEIKACLYFSIILFYYMLYCFLQGSLYAGIVVIIEIVLTAYAMNYIQVYLLNNFDEAECLGKKEALLSVFCAAAYTAVSYFFGWYDRNRAATAGFFFYMLLCYVCIFLIFKIKRDIDTAQMNRELEDFKRQKDKKER